MARQRHTPKGRLLITGTVLLILLVAGILIAGRTINGVAVQMSGRIVRHISEYHYRLLQVEFERSEGVLDASVQFMRERTAPTDAELHVLAATLMRMDPKAGCVWFAEAGGRTIRSYPRGKNTPHHGGSRRFPAAAHRRNGRRLGAQPCDRFGTDSGLEHGLPGDGPHGPQAYMRH